MSSRRRIGLSEGNGQLLRDRAPQTILTHRLGYDIDGTTQDGFETGPELVKASEIGESGDIFRQSYDDIHVGIVPGVAAGNRPDQGEAGHARASPLPLGRAQLCDDVILYHAP